MKSHARQYTIRNVPPDVDRALRRRARELGRSFNQVALDALAAGAGIEPAPRRDLTGIVGSLSAKEADNLEAALRAQQVVDPDLWR